MTSAVARLCWKAKTVAGASKSSVLRSKTFTAFRTSWLRPASAAMLYSSHPGGFFLETLQELVPALLGLFDGRRLGLVLGVLLHVAVVQDLGGLVRLVEFLQELTLEADALV